MRVFISYGDAADQVNPLRLQALGSANGLTVYVPPVYTRQGQATSLDPEAGQKLHGADVILGVVSSGLTESCRQELNAGLALRKNMIVMAYPNFAAALEPYFPSNLDVIDPANPAGDRKSPLSNT